MFEEIRGNKLRSWLIMSFFIFILIGLTILILSAISAIYGLGPGEFAFVIVIVCLVVVVYSLIGYYSGDNMILTMSGARPVTKKEYPYLVNAVEGLVVAAGLKTVPKIYVINDSALNAFATGRDPEHSSITVTTGLLEKMNRQELEGVIAHEMSHIQNYDIRMMMLSAVLVGAIVLISDFMLRSFLWGNKSDREDRGSGIIIIIAILSAILAPIFAQLIKLAVSRGREYLADANGAALTRYPPGLAGALEKIKNDPDPLVDNANRATAHLFISNPFRKTTANFASLFSTHPPIEERIKRLRAM